MYGGDASGKMCRLSIREDESISVGELMAVLVLRMAPFGRCGDGLMGGGRVMNGLAYLSPVVFEQVVPFLHSSKII